MSLHHPKRSRIGGYRIAMLSSGLLLVMVSLSADAFGISVAGSFGRDQLLLSIFGVVLLGAGILGRSFPAVYKGAGLTAVTPDPPDRLGIWVGAALAGA